MKKVFIPLLMGLSLLHSPYTHPRFSEGILVGGLAGLTAGLVTTAIANQCNEPDVVFVNACPLRQCTACGPQSPCTTHRAGARTHFRRTHTKQKRRHQARRRPQLCPALLDQEQALSGSIRELRTLKASIHEESKRVEHMIKEMELKLRETELQLQQQNRRIV